MRRLSIFLLVSALALGQASLSGNAQVLAGILGQTSSGVSYTPDSVCTGASALKRWYRADATDCGGGSGTCTNGQSINTWTDKAGIGNATYNAGTKAVFTTGEVNGQPAGFVNATDLFYAIGGTGYTPTAMTVYAMVKMHGATAVDKALIAGGGGNPELRITGYTNLINLLSQNTANIATSTGALNLADVNYHKIAITYKASDGTWAFYIDSDTADSSGQASATSFSGPMAWFLGSSGEGFLGNVAELFVCDGVNSSTQISQIMGSSGYFKDRYSTGTFGGTLGSFSSGKHATDLGATSGSFSTANGQLAVGYVYCYNGVSGHTPGGGWNRRATADNNDSVMWEDQVASSGGQLAATVTCANPTGYISLGFNFMAQGGTPAFVQGTINGFSGAPIVTPNLSVTSGNLLVACMHTEGPSSTSISVNDTLSNQWKDVGTGLVGLTLGGNPNYLQCWWTIANGNGTDAATVNWSGGGGSGTVSLAEYSNIKH